MSASTTTTPGPTHVPSPIFHVQVRVGAKVTTFRFQRSTIRIGRMKDNDLVLPDPSVPETFSVVIQPQLREFWLGPRDDFKNLENGDSTTIGRYDLTFQLGEPPCEREEEFLAQLRLNPADDQTRLVYADWLEENNQGDAAELIRLQLRLLTLDPDSSEFRIRGEELQHRGQVFPSAWRRVVARPPIENCDVRFELQCPKQWAQLQPTRDPNKRFCGSCQKNVHYAPDVKTARRLALAGECVAVDVSQPRREGDLEDEGRYVLAGMISPPSY